MCDFCVKHGEGEKRYLQARNYSDDLLSDIRRRRFIEEFVSDTDGLVRGNKRLDIMVRCNYNVGIHCGLWRFLPMKTNIVKIGNSQGIRIPKVLLEQSRLGTEVELEVRDDAIILRPVSKPRQGWDEKFRLMASEGNDRMVDKGFDHQTEFDRDEWEW